MNHENYERQLFSSISSHFTVTHPNYKPKYTFYFPGHVVLLYDMIYDIKGAVPFSSKIFLAQKKIAKSILFAENESVKSIKKAMAHICV